jgi:hypothetical protein
MNSDLLQFAQKYLSIVFATLMSVSFVAFLSIPYSLGAHPGDARVSQSLVQTEVQAPVQSVAPLPAKTPEA